MRESLAVAARSRSEPKPETSLLHLEAVEKVLDRLRESPAPASISTPPKPLRRTRVYKSAPICVILKSSLVFPTFSGQISTCSHCLFRWHNVSLFLGW